VRRWDRLLREIATMACVPAVLLEHARTGIPVAFSGGRREGPRRRRIDAFLRPSPQVARQVEHLLIRNECVRM
jgi:hypothetical protein